MGHSEGFSYVPWVIAWDFGYALWAIAQDFVTSYEPQRRILLYAMGHSTGFCYALWAIAQDLVMRFGPRRQTMAQNLKAWQIL